VARQPFHWPKFSWPKEPIDLKRVGEWISMLRDLAALLFIPFLCLYGVILVAILWRVFGDMERDVTIQLAVVNYIGGALIGLLILIGLGVLWLQRRNIPSLSVTTPMGTVNIGSGDAAQATMAAAVVDAITPKEAPSVAAAVAGGVPPPSKPAATAAADAALPEADLEPEPEVK
jgi:hypothetical protein